MQVIRSLLRSNPQVVKKLVQQRQMSAIAVPSRNKVSKGEMIFLASMMVGSWLFIPGWVLVNIKNYRHRD